MEEIKYYEQADIQGEEDNEDKVTKETEEKREEMVKKLKETAAPLRYKFHLKFIKARNYVPQNRKHHAMALRQENEIIEDM